VKGKTSKSHLFTSSHIQPVSMIKAKANFLESRFFSSQSGIFENFSDFFDWLDKSRPSKKATFVLIM